MHEEVLNSRLEEKIKIQQDVITLNMARDSKQIICNLTTLWLYVVLLTIFCA